MKTVKRITILKAVALIMLIAGWVAVPFISNNVQADGTPLILVRNAVLTSPSGSINPHGEAEWQLYQSGNREIEVEIEDVTLGQGTVLNAVVDGNVIGQLIVDDRQKARLKLRTENGQAVPTVNAGSTVQVRNGTTVLVAGTFGGGAGATPSPSVSPTGSATPSVSPTSSPSPSVSPTGSPSPSPSATPGAGDLFAGLSGPTLNGVVPTGFAAYEIHSSRTELEVRVRQVNLAIGTQLTVQVNGSAVGTMSLQSGGEGRLRLRSDNGQFVPVVTAGSTISIRSGGSSILSGIFSGFSATPSPSPTATGTPGGTPSPSPSPGQGRSFEAHLTGGGMSPAVATSATGELKVSLNAAETQATVFGEFHNLSSNQTGARIESTIGTTLLVHDLGIAGGRNGNFATVTFDVTAVQVQQLRAGLWSAVITSVNNPNGEIRGSFRPRGGEGDLNGDGLNDFAIFRPSTGVWWAANADGISTQNHGSANDRVVSGDYDGDGKTDVAVYRDSNGQGVWDIKRSSDGGVTTHAWGLPSDIPVRGDFDGDGRLDPAVYRPSQGVWYVLKSDNSGYIILNWGLAEDKPVPADIDGDGKDDIVVFRPSNGVWYWLRSSDGGFGAANWGLSQDIPTPGDYDGDGKDDLAVFRPDTGVWYWYRSSDLGFGAAHWGLNGDIPVPGNYDNDGKTDIAVFRPSDGNWYVYRSTDLGFSIYNFGLSGDVPLVAR